MREIFKPVPGYRAEASNLGNIRGPSGRILSQYVDKRGYKRVGISKKHRRRSNEVTHRLVLLAWCGEPKPGYEACHGEKGKLCNELTNLRWGTKSENANDRIKAGNHALPKGVLKGPWRRVRRDDGKVYKNASEAAREMNCAPTTIHRACKGTRLTAKGYTWEYLPVKIRRSDGKIYDDVHGAAIDLGVSLQAIYNALKGTKVKNFTFSRERI